MSKSLFMLQSVTIQKSIENPQTLTGQAFQRFGRTKKAIKYNHYLPFTFRTPSATTKQPPLPYLNFDTSPNNLLKPHFNAYQKPPGNRIKIAGYLSAIVENHARICWLSAVFAGCLPAFRRYR